jgi:peptide deformylase
VRIKSEGFTARAFQHELDHLDGVLFTDKLTSIDTLRRVEELVAEAESEEAEEKKEDAERTLVPS